MKRICNILLLLLILTISCYAGSHDKKVEWIKKTNLKVHYFIPVNKNEIICYEVGKGYLVINDRGKASKEIIFDNDDQRRNVSNIKILSGIGNYGILTGSEEEKYIVEILDNFKIEKIIKVPVVNLSRDDFLISADKKRYCGFGSYITDQGQLPLEWINIKSGEVVNRFKAFTVGNKNIYLINNKFYENSLGYISIYDIDGIEITTKYFNEEMQGLQNYSIFFGFDYRYNNFIYDDDGYFYIMPNNLEDSKSWSYYIVKLDLDLNLIGKRRVDLSEKYDKRCTSSVYVDKKGYIYVASDKEMTITKFKPIKNGEDSLINLCK